jgi:hypothetical protein
MGECRAWAKRITNVELGLDINVVGAVAYVYN